MKKYQKIVPIMLSAILLFTPSTIYAEEPDPSTNPNPEQTESPKEETKITLDKTELSLEVGDSVQLTATVTPEDTSAKVEWQSSQEDVALVKDGTVRAQSIGVTTITATVNGVSATCTVTVEEKHVTPPPEEKEVEVTLKSLKIKNGELDKSFQSNILEYTVTIDSKTSALSIEYETTESDDKVGVLVSGNSNLKNGSEVKIIVSEKNPADEKNQKMQTYVLKIQKNTVNLNLKSLKINGYALNETFSSDKTNYTANIPYEIQTISLEVAAEDGNNKVTTSGLTNLKVGTNLVVITISDENGNSKVYQITVTRDEEQKVEENPTSIITSSSKNTENHDSAGGVASVTTPKDDGFLKYLIVSIACFILLAIGGIGIYFYLKTSPKKMKKELKMEKEKVDSSPIVEVKETQDKVVENPIIENDMIETKEFYVEDFNQKTIESEAKKEEPENLFDEEDV